MSHIADAVLDTSRSAADRAADANRLPVETLRLTGLDPEMSVLELEPGKGYYTDILGRILSTSGRLMVQQPKSLDAFLGRAARQRVEGFGTPAVSYSDASFDSLAADAGSLDRVLGSRPA